VTIFLLIAMMPIPNAAHTADEPFVTDLIAGGGNKKSAMDAGNVLVWNDGDYLYVKFTTEGDWTIVETHVHVALTLGGIPQTKNNNPIPGLFEYSSTEVLYVILMPDDWKFDIELYIAAHAVVVCGDQEETGWGDGFTFNDKNWATYFKYKTQESGKIWTLPDYEVSVTISPGAPDSYFDVELAGVGDGYNISDGSWNGWCVDTEVNILAYFDALVYSSYDSFLPAWACDDEQWDYINYILNHKHPDAGMWDIQWAIWYFSDVGIEIPDTLPIATEMVNDALANGEGFRPGEGQWGAVLLLHEGIQLIFIEVDP
jgi:hypothetical protein